MSLQIFILTAVVLMVAAALLSAWLLPILGIASPFVRYACFGVAGAIIGLLYVRMKGAPRA